MSPTTWMATAATSRPRQELATLAKPSWGWYAPPSALETLAASFESISLAQMDSVALLNRLDTKFVMSTRQLVRALAELSQDYWMLALSEQKLHHYRTLYFDTANFELYRAHVNGRADRYKVRSREYTGSRLSFMEVKHKTPKGRTIKDRIRTTQPIVEMTPEIERWLGGISPLSGGTLEPKLWNTFKRLTLVSKQGCERVTLDVDLMFCRAEKVLYLDDVAVAEVKRDTCSHNSPFLAQMRAQRIKPRSFSKYSFGVSMLYDHVKKNALKPQRLWIEKTLKGATRDE